MRAKCLREMFDIHDFISKLIVRLVILQSQIKPGWLKEANPPDPEPRQTCVLHMVSPCQP
jgi:hypothetical protein